MNDDKTDAGDVVEGLKGVQGMALVIILSTRASSLSGLAALLLLMVPRIHILRLQKRTRGNSAVKIHLHVFGTRFLVVCIAICILHCVSEAEAFLFQLIMTN